jgi:hypothetical protein
MSGCDAGGRESASDPSSSFCESGARAETGIVSAYAVIL